MAVEIGRFLHETLARLPADHPDRAFVAGLAQTVDAYASRLPAAAVEPLSEPDAPEGATPAPAPETPETTAAPEQERVKLRGRVGATPTVRTTPKGVKVGSFPFAVHDEGSEQATWYKVYAFRERAEKLAALALTRGQYAEIIGYRQDVVSRRRDGKETVEHRLNAVNITAR